MPVLKGFRTLLDAYYKFHVGKIIVSSDRMVPFSEFVILMFVKGYKKEI